MICATQVTYSFHHLKKQRGFSLLELLADSFCGRQALWRFLFYAEFRPSTPALPNILSP
jgi:hypothetical protein